MNKMISTVFVSLGLLSGMSCQNSNNSSEVKVTNGVLGQPKALTAVISQDGCTGTFVSPTVILTAAHCADKGFTYKGVRTKSFQSMPEAIGKPWNFDIDVRILVFPSDVAPAYIPVSTARVKGDELIVFAGYGTYDLKNNKNDGKFRWGTGRLGGFEADEHLVASHGSDLERIAGTEGTNSGVGPGDSGGPLLRDGMLIGIASAVAGEGNDRHKSVHVNLTQPDILAFLKEAKKNGADIRFDEKPTIPYEECFDVDSTKEMNSFLFTVPHRQISSVSGSWSTCSCEDCALTDAKGYTTGTLSEFRPDYENVPAGALLVWSKRATDANNKKVDKEGFWNGSAMMFKEMAFGADMKIHDNSLTGNKGTVKVCFQ
ncbi:MAG: trypsin-like serine protease [Proteobacteria bacterium]|nr:MAG: trypsin-like serine protease [Pseudomonadota bacterium]